MCGKINILKNEISTHGINIELFMDIFNDGRVRGNIDTLIALFRSQSSKDEIILELIKLNLFKENNCITFNKKEAAKIIGVSQRKLDEIRRSNEINAVSLSKNTTGRKIIVYEKKALIDYILKMKEEDELE